MTISGMTGFARAEGEHDGGRWTWELKSVNGRGLDIKLRTPSGLEGLEPAVRAAAQERFKRGSLQASLSLARDAAAASVRLDLALVERLLQAGQSFKGRVRRPRWDGLLGVRGVVTGEDGELDAAAKAALEAALLEGLAIALDRLAEARKAEGQMLRGALGEAASRMEKCIAAARGSAAAMPGAALERIRQRLAAIAPEVQFDPARLAQEAAIVAAKADVQEELDRLAAHAAELRALLAAPGPAGRRLDFLSQELGREANTLCAKSADLDLTRTGLELKNIVDQIKEQAANVE